MAVDGTWVTHFVKISDERHSRHLGILFQCHAWVSKALSLSCIQGAYWGKAKEVSTGVNCSLGVSPSPFLLPALFFTLVPYLYSSPSAYPAPSLAQACLKALIPLRTSFIPYPDPKVPLHQSWQQSAPLLPAIHRPLGERTE